jgi:eukaryotic-like serine/threonine-protein kinase
MSHIVHAQALLIAPADLMFGAFCCKGIHTMKLSMPSLSTGKGSAKFWRTDWFTGLVVVLFVLIARSQGLFDGLENRWYDAGISSSSREPSKDIEIIDIDDASIANIGRWPFSREVHAQLLDKLTPVKPKAITFTVFFSEPQTDKGLAYVRKIKDALGASAGTGAVGQLIGEAEQSLDTDQRFAASLAQSANVILPSVYTVSGDPPAGKPDKPLPDYLQRSALSFVRDVDLFAQKGVEPLQLLGEKAAAIGHLNQANDRDGAVRRELLVLNYYGTGIPSIALLTAAKSLNLDSKDIKASPDGNVMLGKRLVQGNEYGEMLPQFYPDKGNQRAFSRSSYFDVISGKIPPAKFAGKVVLIGASAQGVGTIFTTPASPGTYPVDMVAHVTSSLLSEHYIVQPTWAGTLGLVLTLLCSGFIVAGLPRMSAGVGAVSTAVTIGVLLGLEYVFLSSQARWLPLVFPVCLLVIGYVVITTKRYLITEAGKNKSDAESAETNRMMGLALQGQGQLDMAFDRFRRVPIDEVHGAAIVQNLQNLGLDFERKRQFNKAQAVYEYIAQHDKGNKEVQAKLTRAKNLSETVILGGGGHPGGTLVLDNGSVEKPMLGRYQVEKELGKGAMGVVYLGKDPKIGRVVAIKTMALSQEFEGDELADARERFFREAETAGRLQHQNIVTIFDAGEEHDLAYIAMEFLKGKDLVEYTKPDNLLPTPQVVSIIARVAQALAYAHTQNVVHRDIKPANIMYDLAADNVKVTDFGIARITDSSKTKTGLVLGTPSFMSPEQIAGKRVDGRSDLYSLGVMLFQMLAGLLPFRGESMAELMYKIANEEAPDIRQFRDGIPDALANVVALALSKRPETRYQTGDEFARDLMASLSATPSKPSAPAPKVDPAHFDATVPVNRTQSTAAVDFKPTMPPEFQATQPMDASFLKTNAINAQSPESFAKTVVQDATVSTPPPSAQSADLLELNFEKTVINPKE